MSTEAVSGSRARIRARRILRLYRRQDTVSIYDPVQKRWSAGPPLPGKRHHLAAAGLEQSVYVSGGASDLLMPWVPQDNFWRLDAETGSWRSLASMPEPRWGHRMVAHEGRLYVIGGRGPSSRVLIFNPAEGDPAQGWSMGAEMPVQRDHLSVVVAHGQIWAIGGRDPRSLSRVDIYDPVADRWMPGPTLPPPVSGAAEGVVNDVILIYGGEEPDRWNGEVYDRHWMLDLRVQPLAWKPTPPPPLPVHGANGAVFQNTLVIFGGATRHGLRSTASWIDAAQWLNPESISRADGPRQ